jgi:peptidoglycan/xylan/chitin deacetylase (PgdA/CDA1 family)
MKNVRAVASEMARNAATYGGVSRLLCRMNGRARILMLHGVGAADCPAEVFRAQVGFLQRVFHIVPLAEVLSSASREDDRRPKLALTFDDGLKNNFTVAYPIICELQVPVTFFVCPGLIESGRWAWNFECRARLSRLAVDRRLAFAAEIGVQSAQIEAIVRGLKYLPNTRRVGAQQRLQLLTSDFTATETERLEFDIMSWFELKSLDPALVTIGGHSVQHEILTRLEPAHLEREVAGCRAWLERELGRPVRHFCYPDGAYDAQVLECVARHFDTAVTTEKDWVPRTPEPFRLPRIPGAENLRDLAWRVHRPTA